MNENLEQEKKAINHWKKDDKYNTENMLNISEIRWNTIILKDWWLRSIIKVFWLNLNLKNYDEQQIVIQQYSKFINWLDFPVQILARSTYLDLTDYISFVADRVWNIENDTLRRQWEEYVKFIENINSQQWLIYTKEFYLVVPYSWSVNAAADDIAKPWWKKVMAILDNKETPEKIVSRYRSFMKNKKFLDTRCNIVIEWLRWIWVFCERLEVSDIVSLLFKVYNPNSHKEQSNFDS